MLPQAQGLPSGWGGHSAFLRWDRWAASEWRSWLIFQIRKSHFRLSWASAWVEGAEILWSEPTWKRIFWFSAIPDVAVVDSRIQKWNNYIHCLQLWAPVSVAALVDKDSVCMSSFAPSNASLFILCSSCRMFWANQSPPEVIGQNGDTWIRKKSINLILKRIPFSWVNCLWSQKVTTHVGGPASCLAMSLWRDVASQTDHPPPPVASSSPQLLQKSSK